MGDQEKVVFGMVVRGGFDAMDKKRTVVSFVTAQVRFFVRACWM